MPPGLCGCFSAHERLLLKSPHVPTVGSSTGCKSVSVWEVKPIVLAGILAYKRFDLSIARAQVRLCNSVRCNEKVSGCCCVAMASLFMFDLVTHLIIITVFLSMGWVAGLAELLCANGI